MAGVYQQHFSNQKGNIPEHALGIPGLFAVGSGFEDYLIIWFL
jgi:hypothetical protein